MIKTNQKKENFIHVRGHFVFAFYDVEFIRDLRGKKKCPLNQMKVYHQDWSKYRTDVKFQG